MINTQQKLKKLPFTRSNQILMSCYLYNKIYQTDKAKRIISLIYQSEYSNALEKIKSYNNKIPIHNVIQRYCGTKKDFDYQINELIKFFNERKNQKLQT